MKNIVVLDGFALNPGDLDWSSLEALGNVTIYDRTPEHLVPERSKHAHILLTNKSVISGATIRELPQLEYIGVIATGYNVVDLAAARERGIPVTNVPAYGTASVAQLTFALILELCNRVGLHADSVRAGEWTRSIDFSYWKAPLTELDGKTLGIIGFGQIGQAVARIALAFGMKVIVSHKYPERDAMAGVAFVSQEVCFREADIVSLHCPLNVDNREFVNAALLATMKKSAFLINTSRGPLIREADLAAALAAGTIAGAGLDVLSVEPPAADNPLITAPGVLITPHIAWATRDARSRLMMTAIDNVRAFLAGQTRHVVN
ncbi:D-2-hydroxyacid dehydrogenase [Chitinophaga nivalis]|uniref:D-2-hydroxyacid dehydrogenase n=1 Tax=Chitinophaga nivalis TaxID=2991709 RepID=A0ABT3IF72_9BACT|nr:D-2-hydroxyacid dehydrogenase [Chitinophaga nivalis]MCW3467752.1 D-2-hydroxyacid dehydrogenase [Chitinophaga nivalis]MCW3482556.1 D-2-hydroxyacid dehydrogenase [Chitinophaga nivalis]